MEREPKAGAGTQAPPLSPSFVNAAAQACPQGIHGFHAPGLGSIPGLLAPFNAAWQHERQGPAGRKTCGHALG